MNKAALFCDGTEGYVYPPEPKENELVTFRFRTAKDDADRVGLVTSADTYVMEKECTQGEFDYYTFEVRLGAEPFRYCFEVQSGTEKYYYGRCGISREILEYYNFVVVPGFSTPDWAKGAVMYQIFTDRFYNGDKSNDVETNEYYYIGDYSRRVTNWDKYPANMGVREFYGGDLQGVMDKLDYLQEMGVEVVYFNPLFVSPSNHKYDIQDYDYIDPHYGKIVDDGGEVLPDGVTDNSQATKYKKRTTGLKNLEASNELFIKLVEELHRRGMKVILDGVFNHCGSFNKWMDRERIYEGEKDYEPGAYISADSPYRSYFRFFKEGPENWPYNGNYDGWWGHDTLPKLNYEDSVKLENYILYIGRKWVSPPYNVDGWRLDVAADLGRSNEYNHDFWKKFRRAVKDANPSALILAEHYGDPRDWLKGDEWDTVMNYDAFMEPITWFLTGMEKHSDEAREELLGNIDNFIGSMAPQCCYFYVYITVCNRISVDVQRIVHMYRDLFILFFESDIFCKDPDHHLTVWCLILCHIDLVFLEYHMRICNPALNDLNLPVIHNSDLILDRSRNSFYQFIINHIMFSVFFIIIRRCDHFDRFISRLITLRFYPGHILMQTGYT